MACSHHRWSSHITTFYHSTLLKVYKKAKWLHFTFQKWGCLSVWHCRFFLVDKSLSLIKKVANRKVAKRGVTKLITRGLPRATLSRVNRSLILGNFWHKTSEENMYYIKRCLSVCLSVYISVMTVCANSFLFFIFSKKRNFAHNCKSTYGFLNSKQRFWNQFFWDQIIKNVF